MAVKAGSAFSIGGDDMTDLKVFEDDGKAHEEAMAFYAKAEDAMRELRKTFGKDKEPATVMELVRRYAPIILKAATAVRAGGDITASRPILAHSRA